jgi:outer membrane protein
MKKLLKVALVAICFLSMGNFARAQQKVGYVPADVIMQMLPELKTVQTTMAAQQKQWTDGFTNLNNEFNTKADAFQKNQATMTDAQKTIARSELGDLQKRVQDYQNNATQSLEAKSAELLKPLTDKVRNAVIAVAKEKGYAYVINTSATDLLVAPDADDLTGAVKAKLGISATAPAPIAPAVK